MSERRSEQQLGRRPERRDAGATPPSIAIAALVLGGPESARARARCVFYSSSSSSGLDYRYCPHVLAGGCTRANTETRKVRNVPAAVLRRRTCFDQTAEQERTEPRSAERGVSWGALILSRGPSECMHNFSPFESTAVCLNNRHSPTHSAQHL